MLKELPAEHDTAIGGEPEICFCHCSVAYARDREQPSPRSPLSRGAAGSPASAEVVLWSEIRKKDPSPGGWEEALRARGALRFQRRAVLARASYSSTKSRLSSPLSAYRRLPRGHIGVGARRRRLGAHATGVLAVSFDQKRLPDCKASRHAASTT